MKYNLNGLKNYADLAGRGRYTEYWYLLIFYLVLMLFIVGCTGSAGDKNKVAEVDQKTQNLKKDLQHATAQPTLATDSISYYLKDCISQTIKGIETNEIAYFTRKNGNKLLILAKVGDFKGVKKESRKILVEEIEYCLLNLTVGEIIETYIGIQGNWNMLMVKTPTAANLGGKFADEDLLLPFYDSTSTTKKLQ